MNFLIKIKILLFFLFIKFFSKIEKILMKNFEENFEENFQNENEGNIFVEILRIFLLGLNDEINKENFFDEENNEFKNKNKNENNEDEDEDEIFRILLIRNEEVDKYLNMNSDFIFDFKKIYFDFFNQIRNKDF